MAVGLAPWLLTGARLPLQNLWTAPLEDPDSMPVALLPLSQYATSSIAALVLVGALLAGLVARASADPLATVAAATLLQVVAVAQSFVVLRRGLGLGADPGSADPRASLYWGGMFLGTVVVVALGVLVGSLVAWGSDVQAGLGWVLVAVPLGSWAGLWAALAGGDAGPPSWTSTVVRWLPALGGAVVLVRVGLGSSSRVALWCTGLAVLLVLPPVVTAVATALGTRLLQGDPTETLAVGRDVLRAAATTGVVPALVAVGGALLVVVVSRSRPGARGAAGA